MTGFVAALVILAAPPAPLPPTWVEVAADNTPLSEVLASLEKQAGFPVRVADSPDAGNRKVTLATGKVPFWEAAERVAVAARMHADVVPPPATDPGVMLFANDLPRDRLTTPVPDVGPDVLTGLVRGSARVEGDLRTRHPGAVVFRPGRRGGDSPAVAAGAVRVRAVPFPALPTFAADTIPVVLHFACEPTYVWKGVTGVEVTRAVAGERELDADPVDGPVVVRAVAVEDGAAATVVGRDVKPAAGEGSFPAPALALIRLAAPADGPAVRKLTALEGEVRGEVWGPAEDLGAAAVGKPGKVTRTTGRHGVTFEVLYTAATADAPAHLTVVLASDPRTVRPVGGDPWPLTAFLMAGGTTDGEPLTLTDGKPRPEPVREAFGLSVADAGGEPFDLSVTANKYQIAAAAHTQVVTFALATTAAKPKPPAAVRLRGGVATPVRVPFTLADVPVAAGAKK
jgi:hypothetical protein